MATTEGSQAIITQNEIHSIDFRKSYRSDFLKLHINSNDTYSRTYYYPSNNRHHFTIVFNDSAAEALQNRISKCNRYQIVSFKMPIRNNKGICELSKLPYSLPVVKTKQLQRVPTPAANPLNKNNFKSIFDLITYDDYVASHEILEKFHVKLTCSSLQQDKEEVMYDQKFSYKLPLTKKHVIYTLPSWTMSGEMTHLRHSSTLYYNNKVQLSQHKSHFSNFSLYPPNPHNTSDMFTRNKFNQMYTSENVANIVNPNALVATYYEEELLYATPQKIRPKSTSSLTDITFSIYPKDSPTAYDNHIIDEPLRLETDLVILFYDEDNVFERHKGGICNK